MHIRPVKCLKYVNVISLKTWNGFLIFFSNFLNQLLILVLISNAVFQL